MILVTGGTGFLGKELIKNLLSMDSTSMLQVLIRAQNIDEAKKRVEFEIFSQLENHGLCKDRIIPILGDVSLENFGLGESEFQTLAKDTSAIYHSAASTALNGNLEELRAINVGGTLNVVKLAQISTQAFNNNCALHHISTAYVAGNRSETVKPCELSLNAHFRNHYERTKAEAECEVKQSGVSHIIYRPSIIVGNSTTGETSAFNVIYVPAKYLAKGLIKALPALPNIPFDVVPVNYVAKAIATLGHFEKAHCQAYHLCAGVGRESTPKEILESLFESINKHCSKRRENKLSTPPLVAPDLLLRAISTFTAAAQSVKLLEKIVSHHLHVIRQTLPFIPYMIGNPRFDTSNTTASLSGRIVEPEAPLFKTYAEKLFKYCVDTNWGKDLIEQPVSRPQVLKPLPQ